MKFAFRAALVVSMLVTCPALALAAEDGARVVDDGWVAAAKSGNVDALVALYAPDATFYPVGGADEIKGAAAIRKYYDQWLSQITITDAAIVATYDTVGDLSVGHGTATLNYSPKAGGSPVVVTVRVTAVARRINGKWRYTVDHASLPQK